MRCGVFVSPNDETQQPEDSGAAAIGRSATAQVRTALGKERLFQCMGNSVSSRYHRLHFAAFIEPHVQEGNSIEAEPLAGSDNVGDIGAVRTFVGRRPQQRFHLDEITALKYASLHKVFNKYEAFALSGLRPGGCIKRLARATGTQYTRSGNQIGNHGATHE